MSNDDDDDDDDDYRSIGSVLMKLMAYIVQFQKISILPPRKVFCFALPSPLGNSSLASYFACKILTFKTPLPLGISDDLPWGGYGFFLELHIVKKACFWCLELFSTKNCEW